MKTLTWLAISASLFLSACATSTSVRVPESLLQDCAIQGAYPSLDAVMEDQTTTTFDLYDFAGQAEDAAVRCTADKEAIRRILKEAE